MFALPASFTQAPNIDAFNSPFEEGYGAGFAQMSDAVKRMQQKRALNQQDVSLNLQKRAQDIAMWQTQVQANLERAKMAQQEKLTMKGYALQAQEQAFKIAQAPQQFALAQQGVQTERMAAQANLIGAQAKMAETQSGIAAAARNQTLAAEMNKVFDIRFGPKTTETPQIVQEMQRANQQATLTQRQQQVQQNATKFTQQQAMHPSAIQAMLQMPQKQNSAWEGLDVIDDAFTGY